jgi:hypothetical protein
MAAALLSPMHFTYCAPGRIPYAASTGRTLQFYSIKVAEIKKALGLTWPLDVYGVVAARDNVDRNRNIIFLRGRDDCQTLTQKVLIILFIFSSSYLRTC